MNPTPKRLWIAALLAASGAVAIAQSPAQPAAGEQPPRAASAEVRRAAPRDPAQWQQRMAERHAQRLAQLKTALKLSAAQEGAWNQFVAASQPPALRTPPARPDFAQLSTPERIDLMQQQMAERQAQMKQHGDAVKTFYAQLTPEQQKTFDNQPMRGPRGAGPRHGPHGGGWGGYGGYGGYGCGWGGPGMMGR